MTAMDTEDITILEMVGDIEIPCDHIGDGFCPGAPAKWAMLWKCPSCSHGGLSLACDDCKDMRLSSSDGVEDISGCGDVIAPARHMYVRVEAL